MKLNDQQMRIFEADLRGTQVPVRSFLARMGVQRDDVDDVAQEVYIVYYKIFHKRPEADQLLPWLKGIARNLALHYFRDHKVPLQDLESVMDTVGHAQTPFEDLASKDTASETLKHCLQKLSEKYRGILLLFYQNRMSYEEIAKMHDTTAKTIGMMLYRSKLTLKECLEKECAA